MRKLSNILIFASATSAWGSAAPAQNLLTNSEFDENLSGWTITASDSEANASWDATTGSPGVGSLVLDVHGGMRGVTASQCLDLLPQSVDFATRFTADRAGGLASDFFGVIAVWDQPGCDAGGGASVVACSKQFPNVTGGFAETSIGNCALPPSTKSVRVSIIASSGFMVGDYISGHFDHVRFGPSGTVPVKLQSYYVD